MSSHAVAARVTLSMTLEMTPFVDDVLARGQQLAGKGPQPSDEERAAARAAAAAALDEASALEREDAKERIAAALPAGVSLVSLRARRKDLSLTSQTELALEDLRALPGVELPGADEGEPPARPFETFQVIDEEGAIVVEGAPPAPPPDSPPGSFAFALDTALEPVEHNATRAEGRRLVWELPFSGTAPRIHARFRR